MHSDREAVPEEGNSPLENEAGGPLVSCILATRNRPGFFRQALRCYLRQAYRPSELVVVDDGERTVEDLCIGQPGVRYIRLSKYTVLGAKLNLGIEQCGGSILQKMDDDDYYHPAFLERAVAHLAAVDTVVAWDCFLVLLAGDGCLRHSGHSWAAGATLCFYRELWQHKPFRDVPSRVDRWFLADTGHSIRRVCEPELFVVVRHGGNTWTAVNSEYSVDDYLRKRPPYPKPLRDMIEPADWGFYEALARGEVPSG